jgi:glycogen synthase
MYNNDVLRREIQRVQPDIIHVWNLGGISKSIIATLQLTGRTVVYDISDHWIARSLKADVWLDWWHRQSSSRAAQLLRTWWAVTGQQLSMARRAPIVPIQALQFKHIYFCSAALRRITAEKGYAVDHASVIHCPVDTQRFTGTAAPAERPMRRLLYVGRLTEDKGIMTALRAMRALPPSRHGLPSSEFTLTVCGHGEQAYVQQLQHYVQQHKLPVTFTQASPEQMPSIYASHDALLFTSEWEEPFALTPLEAMATGLPVIGTTTGGSAELLCHGKNSLTYRAADPAQLAQRILQLAADPSLRHSISLQGQQDVRTHCSEQLIVSQIEDYLYQALAADSSSSSHHQRSTLPPRQHQQQEEAVCKA